MKKVYTFGVFDLLHVGHIRLLEEAKALGDYLIVGVMPDDVASSFKRDPMIPLEQRMEMLKALKCVDEVVIQSSPNPLVASSIPEFDIIAKGPGANWENLYQGFVGGVLLDYHEGVSTSDIINKIKQS